MADEKTDDLVIWYMFDLPKIPGGIWWDSMESVANFLPMIAQTHGLGEHEITVKMKVMTKAEAKATLDYHDWMWGYERT